MTPTRPDGLLASGRLLRSFLAAWVLVLAAAAAALFLVAAPRMRASAVADLATVMRQSADVRVVSLQDWRRHALADARTVAGFPTSRVLVQRHPEFAPDPHFAAILGNFAALHEVSGLAVLDRRGDVRASNPALAPGAPEARALASAAMASGLDTVEFVRGADGRPVIVVCSCIDAGDGAVVAEYDPGRWLYPVLDAPLAISRWGTALLLRREGDEVVFLSAGAPRPGHAPRRTFARSARPLFAPSTELVAGADERGADAFTVVRELSGSRWALAIEVDRNAALAAVDGTVRGIGGGLAALLTALLALGYSLVWGQRRASESAISRSQARFSAVLEHAGDPILMLDESLRVLVVSRRAERFYGRTATDLVGRRAFEALRAPGTPAEPPSVLAEARERGGVVFESEHRTADAERVPVEISLNRARVDERSTWLAVIRDLRARRATEERILRLNRLLQVIAAIATEAQREPEAATLLGRSCRIAVDVGGFVCAAVGLLGPGGGIELAALAARPDDPAQPPAVVARRARVVFPPTERAVTTGERVVVADLADGGDDPALRQSITRMGLRSCASSPIVVDGRTRGALTLVSAEPGAFDDEAIALVDGMAADLGVALRGTEERRARARLEQRMSALFAIGPVGFALTAADGVMTSANDAFLRLVGASRVDLDAGRLRWQHVVEDLDPVARREGAPYETSALRPDGVRVPLLVGRVRPDPASEEAIAVVLDLTQLHETAASLRTTQERLLQSQRLETVGRLAGGVAHDFNNLLTIIQGHAELLRSGNRMTGDDDAALDQILRASGRAASLTRQLLAFSRQQVLEPRVIDPGALVHDMEKMLRRVLGEHIEFAVDVPTAPGRVLADPGQLEQVLLNLVVNARDALPAGGRIRIDVGDRVVDAAEAAARPALVPGTYVRIAVSDDGVGIPPEVMARVFEPFYTTKEVGKGTGLGLATAYGIVTQSGGDIGVTSTPGAGACFEVLLPRVDTELPTPESAAGAPRGAGETVLLVEDEPAVLQLAQRMLLSDGYRVIPAAGADEALRAASSSGPIHVLATDVVLRGMSGRDLADRMRIDHPGLAVLLMSGYAEHPGAAPPAARPDAAFLAKPFTAEQLRAALRTAIARRPAPPASGE